MIIEFEHTLPAMRIDGKQNGTYNNEELGFPGILTTTDYRLGEFMHQLRNIIIDDRRLVFIDGKILVCSKNWIRDHVHEMKGFKHWEYDIGSFINFIIDTQREDGMYYELIKQLDDEHWAMVNDDCRVFYYDDNLSLVRLELEADIEYLVVEGALNYYRVTGDKNWLKNVLPKLEKGIEYCLSDPKRFDKEHGLVKRPFTIDTWDFYYEKDNHSKAAPNRRIEKDTPMSIMHGDNTGVYQAMNQLSYFNKLLGNSNKATYWENKSKELKENIFKYLYNGNFFIHEYHLGHDGADDKESIRLSLSNAYAMNRGILNDDQKRKIVDSYVKFKEESGYFAEWYSIYPPYDDFIGYKPGQYVNGAISPFTAGELAKGAFSCGYEEYGWNVISRFVEMMERDKKIYFLYSPVDCKPQDKQGPSAWGASALLSAIDEGLAGIVDTSYGYKTIDFSPRFVVTNYTELRYVTGYEKTGAMVDIRFILKDNGLRYDIFSPAEMINAHILIPNDKNVSKVIVDGKTVPYSLNTVHKSKYVDFVITPNKKASIEIIF